MITQSVRRAMMTDVWAKRKVASEVFNLCVARCCENRRDSDSISSLIVSKKKNEDEDEE